MLLGATALLSFTACKKEETSLVPKDYSETLMRSTFDFSKHVGQKGIVNLNNAMIELNIAAKSFYIDTNQYNLDRLRTTWMNAYTEWCLTEGFQFGPIKENSYIEKIGSNATNPVYIQDLLNSSNPLEISDIEALPNNQKGLHAMEFVIFGNDTTKALSSFSWKERKYLLNLSEVLVKNTTEIHDKWINGNDNFVNQIMYAGRGSKKYSKYNNFFNDLAVGMSDICSKIVQNKLGTPYNAIDSSMVEAPFSNRSLEGITNNIASLKAAYLGHYAQYEGYGLKDLIKYKNAGLEGKMNERLNTVDNALSKITMSLDSAIYLKRDETKALMDAVDSLKSTINAELVPSINEYIKE